MAWLIINTLPNREHKVVAQLEREGSISYMPLARKWRRPSGRRRPFLVEVPAFACYLFCKPPAPHGLHDGHILIVAGQYCQIADREIAIMQEVQFIFDETPIHRRRHKRGDQVRGNHGLLGAISGTVIVASAQHAVVELSNGMRINVPVELLEQALIALFQIDRAYCALGPAGRRRGDARSRIKSWI
jgi:Transcription termination factor nusG